MKKEIFSHSAIAILVTMSRTISCMQVNITSNNATKNSTISDTASEPPQFGLIFLVVALSLILLFLIITLVMPMSTQNVVFWCCFPENDHFNYIDVGLYKTRHSMYRKEVYSAQMRKKPRSGPKWLRRNRKKSSLSNPTPDKNGTAERGILRDSELCPSTSPQPTVHRSPPRVTFMSADDPDNENLLINYSPSIDQDPESGTQTDEARKLSLCSIPEENSSGVPKATHYELRDDCSASNTDVARSLSEHMKHALSKSESDIYVDRPDSQCLECISMRFQQDSQTSTDSNTNSNASVRNGPSQMQVTRTEHLYHDYPNSGSYIASATVHRDTIC